MKRKEEVILFFFQYEEYFSLQIGVLIQFRSEIDVISDCCSVVLQKSSIPSLY